MSTTLPEIQEYYETQITILNLQGLNRFEISKHLNKSTTYVQKIFDKLNLIPNIYPKKCPYLDIIKCYYQTGFSTLKIAKTLNVSITTVQNLLLHNLKIPRKIIPTNLNYFSKIDSHEKAYFIGLIAADGAIVKSRNRYDLTISLQEEDRNVLEKLSKVIGYTDRPLVYIHSKKYKSKVTYNCKDQYRFTCGYPILIQSLEKIGITERKSKTLTNILLNLPKEYRKSCILGYFDGDGSISVKYPKNNNYSPAGVIQVRGTKELLLGICDEMSWSHKYVHLYDSTYTLSIGKKECLFQFFNIYKYNTTFLLRKYNKFLQIFN